MTISKLLGATMVTGALAPAGAVAGIAAPATTPGARSAKTTNELPGRGRRARNRWRKASDSRRSKLQQSLPYSGSAGA